MTLTQKQAESGRTKAQLPPIADAEEIQRRLTAVLRQEVTEETLCVDPMALDDSDNRMIRGRKSASIRDVIAAARALAQIQGLTGNRIRLDGSVGVVIADESEA